MRRWTRRARAAEVAALHVRGRARRFYVVESAPSSTEVGGAAPEGI